MRNKKKDIEELFNTINDLKKKDGELLSKITKEEEGIQAQKEHKKFLDKIAIASKNKVPVNQKERRRAKEAKRLHEQQHGDQEDGSGDEQKYR